MPNETSFFKKYRKVILSIIILPLIASFIAAYFIFGDLFEAFLKMWEYRGKPNITASSVTALSYIFTILVAIYALCATTFFSKLVWKVSERSLLVSQQLQDLEKTRDKEIVRENALIVYYDLQRGISNLREIYINCVLNGTEPKINRIYFSTEWIKNVANLRDGLTNQELNRVYKLYEQFYALQNILEEYKANEINDELIEFIERLSKEVFADFIPFSLMDQIKVSSVDELVDIDLYIILQKIYSLTFISSEKPKEKLMNGKTVYETYIDGVLFFVGDSPKAFIGNGALYNSNGNIKCSGHFNSKQFIKDTIYGYYESTKKCYEYTYEEQLIKKGTLYKLTDDDKNEYFYKGEFENGKVSNGITTLFHKNQKISYQGEVQHRNLEGQGTSYNDKGDKEFEGIWKNNNPHNGTKYISYKKVFNGEFRNGHPWTGTAYGLNLSYKVKQFKGELHEGQPINGTSLFFNRDKEGQTLYDLEAYEEWQEENAEEQARAEEDPKYIESQIEGHASMENSYRRRTYSDWTEYIKAEWNEGIVTKAEDKEVNKTVL
ncbi:TPA: hypothetical protein QCP61_005765 [Bacillus cereus]|uniref:hypothetical protein n=1 Tax=Bacillus paranthracis TaxID=2026186 RepID=UPI002A807470|nr:hypothetical protein [Bacillus paranthracis]MDY4270459.1 hypothetical protein [Bacillus paranthracis]MDY4276161.1 hypothetical protein [Bacillus paranthracis]MDY4293366.1 hypothetical protein [Bacillus paranthracis]HDR4393595.1 hypothetical protein [Bacillus cereus]